MIKVSVLYPSEEGKAFNMSYYCINVAVEQGLGGMTPGSNPTYIAMGHLYFNSIEEFQSSFSPHAEAIIGDIPNYTDTNYIVQISEVKI
jgi:uncharacterized protein (TIGR02118 family)